MEIAIVALVIIGAGIFLLVEGGMPIVPNSAAQKIAKAIATAEGFYVSGSLPQRANNPGDLELGDKGWGVLNGKTIFPSASQGWQALYGIVQGWLDGSSKIYSPDWTIQDVANEYVGGQQNPTTDSIAWASNVADTLGVSTDTPIGQVTA